MIAIWTKWVENKFSTFNLLINFYGKYYKNIVKEEVKLASINENDRVLCIGGGYIPSTAIEIVNQTNASVDVIDIDKKAVEQAKNVVHKLGLSDKINIYLKDGNYVDIEPYDVVHIALQVTPKEKIAQYIWDNLRDGSRVVIRMPKRMLKFFYSNISNRFTVKNSRYIESFSLKNKPNTIDNILVMAKN